MHVNSEELERMRSEGVGLERLNALVELAWRRSVKDSEATLRLIAEALADVGHIPDRDGNAAATLLTARALFIRGFCLIDSGDEAEGKRVTEEAIRLQSTMDDPLGKAENFSKAATLYWACNRRDQSLQFLYAGLLQIDVHRCDAPELKGQILLTIGQQYRRDAEYDLAFEYCLNAIDCLERGRDHFQLFVAYVYIAGTYLDLERWDDARPLIERSMALSKQQNLRKNSAWPTLQMGGLYLGQQDYKRAMEHFERALSLAEEYHDLTIAAAIYQQKGNYFFKRDDCESARVWYQRALAELSKPVDLLQRCKVRLNLIFALVGLERYKEALAHATDVLLETRSKGFKEHEATCHDLLAQIYKAQSRYEDALRHKELSHTLRREIFDHHKFGRIETLRREREFRAMRERLELENIQRRQLEEQNRQRSYHLSSMSLALAHKNHLLQSLSEGLNEACRARGRRRSDLLDGLRTELGQMQEPDLAWRNFEEEFATLYPDFFSRLRQRAQGLTNSESRVCALTQTGLSVKEIAHVLFVSESAVLKMRSRIRRKLGLLRPQNLAAFLATL